MDKTVLNLNLNHHLKTALAYFFIVSLLGLLLRLFFVVSLPGGFRFNYILHAHSHTALLGWVYLGLMTLVYKVFLKGSYQPKNYQRIFILTNISVLGMLCSFPFQGYALYSISFSTLYLIASYFFAGFIVKNIPEEYRYAPSWVLVKTGLFYLIFSSLGTWGIGPISAMFGTSSFWFKDALYFFLHFLYSGFFFMTLLGVLFHFLKQRGVVLSKKKFNSAYTHLNIGIVLSYFLSVLWNKPLAIFYFLAGLGAVYQIYGYFLIYRLVKPHLGLLKKEFKIFHYRILKTAVLLMGLRIFLQLLSVLPYIATLAFKFRDFIIGYLHMVFLGIVIPVLLIFLHQLKLLQLSKNAFLIFLIGVGITELMLFYRATAFWLGWPLIDLHLFNWLLLGFSALFPISIAWIILYHCKNNPFKSLK